MAWFIQKQCESDPYKSGKITSPLAAVNDTQLAQQLWQWSERAIGNVL